MYTVPQRLNITCQLHKLMCLQSEDSEFMGLFCSLQSSDVGLCRAGSTIGLVFPVEKLSGSKRLLKGQDPMYTGSKLQ